ncbi:unnamed protein product (mitochondrion) [Plasmodiophora brassicae]|uniref:Uncharacterized protein n=1 Tax=Plasmodiophora brassicae TaxID=37360 RepID=A0A3P3YKL2_PLABS|nr:unnamed protein product [Plasmodiophora brassicae]
MPFWKQPLLTTKRPARSLQCKQWANKSTCNEGGRWSSVQVRNHPVRADSFVILLCGNIDIDSIRQLVACA